MQRTKLSTLPLLCALPLLFAACGGENNNLPSSNCNQIGAGGSGNTGGATGGEGAGGEGNAGGSGAAGGQPPEGPLPGGQTTGKEGNTFDHFNDPGQSGSKDPFEILKQHAEEGPPEVRTRLHGCTKITYRALGNMLTTRGVNLSATSGPGELPTAGELYAQGGDALGVAKYDAREGEALFHTAAGATKLFDIFVQAAPEIIANIEDVEACQVNGFGKPLFDENDGSCVQQTLSCLMGRPATEEDVILCNLMVSSANGSAGDIATKRNVTVAAFLAGAHTCE